MFISNTPRGPSSAVAALLWLHLAEAPVSARELRLPTGDIDLVINLQDGETVVAGPSSRSIVLDNATQIDTLGVVLKVGYARPPPYSASRCPSCATVNCRWPNCGSRAPRTCATAFSPLRARRRGSRPSSRS